MSSICITGFMNSFSSRSVAAIATALIIGFSTAVSEAEDRSN